VAGQLGSADRVRATPDRVQPAVLYAVLNPLRTGTECEQLPAGDDAVLTLRERSYR
jgi:hypothetical protein